MKYTILGFQQDKANNLKLNMNDLLLMRTVKDMYSSASMEYIIVDGDKYMWANQNYLFKQIPIMGSKRTMLRVMDKLIDLSLLEKKLKHSKGNVRGNFSYIKPTVKMDKLQDYEPYDKTAQGLRQNDTRVVTEWHDKDTSIRDTSIRDTKDSPAKAERIPYKDIIDYLNKKTGRNFNHSAKGNKDIIRARWNEGYDLEDFKQAIDNKVAHASDPNHWFTEEYLRPSTLFRPTNFDEYVNAVTGSKNGRSVDGILASFLD